MGQIMKERSHGESYGSIDVTYCHFFGIRQSQPNVDGWVDRNGHIEQLIVLLVNSSTTVC